MVGSAASEGQSQLLSSQASLKGGDGPAHGVHGLTADVTPLAASPTYSWTNLSGLTATAPSSRYTSMTWDAADGYVLLFGGETRTATTATALDDTWTYLNGTWTNITGELVGSPPALVGAALAYYPLGGSVILFGGEVLDGAYSNSTWSYRADIWTNLTTTVGPAPSPRELPSLVWDTNDSELVLYGGINASGTPPGTWVFKNTAWTNVTSHSSIFANLILPSLANDPSDHGVLMEALISYSTGITAPFYAGTYLYSGGTWRNLTASLAQHPPPILAGILNYVSPSEGILLTCGAIVDSAGNQVLVPTVTWQFLNGAWKNVTAQALAGPPPAAFSGNAVDPFDQSIIVFGGELVQPDITFSGTWSLSAPPSVNTLATPDQVDVGTPANFSSAVSLGLSPNRLSWIFGDGATSGSPNPTHAYSSPGLYTAVATATDFGGQVGAGSTAILVTALPTAAITAVPSSPVAGSYAGLTAVVTGGTAPYSFAWTLGDGTTASGQTVSHVYSSAQTYVVHLTITDTFGNSATATLSLVVASAGNSSSGSSGLGLTSALGLALIGIIVILAVVAVVLGVLIARKPRNPPPPVPYGAGSASTGPMGPPTGGTPPAPP